MLSLEVVRFFFFLALPWIIGKILGFFSRRSALKRSPTSPLPPPSRQDVVIYTLVVFAILQYAYLIWADAPANQNFFQLTKTPLNGPVFMLRDNFRQFLNETATIDAAFAKAMETHQEGTSEWDEAEISEFRKYRHEYRYPIISKCLGPLSRFLDGNEPPKPEAEFLVSYYHYLFARVKTPTKRTPFIRFGEDAFVNCHFCKDDSDYWMFIAPSILASYLYFLCMMGLLTILPRKSEWRSIMVLFAGILLLCEVAYYVYPNDMAFLDIYSSLRPNETKATQYQRLEAVRSCLFMGAFIFTLIFPNGHAQSESVLIKDVISKQEALLAQNETLKLQRVAIASDTQLRNFYHKHFEQMEASLNSDEFKRVTAELAKKYDVDRMMEIADKAIDDVLEPVAKTVV